MNNLKKVIMLIFLINKQQEILFKNNIIKVYGIFLKKHY
jgi:hypothetical protein